ncbi:hypothetical protein SDC9_190328 [bioreactor metagenome]|uniref:Uncharacterized protein n=1 Tax=bioreactor metagenome TaxID=1076179 RepID=A0A645HV97_9ZZZZ
MAGCTLQVVGISVVMLVTKTLADQTGNLFTRSAQLHVATRIPRLLHQRSPIRPFQPFSHSHRTITQALDHLPDARQKRLFVKCHLRHQHDMRSLVRTTRGQRS